MPLNLNLVREQFPSLDRPAVFFDNPGGTQIARQSVERINRYLLESNANHEGAFETSQKSDAVLDEAHVAMADFLNAARPEEIVFGNNMTTLTLHMSRTLARTLSAGDEIVVTRLDHDANISPWLLVAEDKVAVGVSEPDRLLQAAIPSPRPSNLRKSRRLKGAGMNLLAFH